MPKRLAFPIICRFRDRMSSDAPTALGCLYSIGAIAQESNGGIQNDVTDLLEVFGVKEDRIYINFFDVPRANVGWSRRTFAG